MVFVLLLLLCFANFVAVKASIEESLLLEYLESKHHSSKVRPAEDYSKPTQVSLKLTLLQINDLDEKTQILSTKLDTTISWESDLFRWNPSNFSGLTEVFLPPDRIWMPDIIVQNSISNFDLYQLQKQRIRVESCGRMTSSAIQNVDTKCRLNFDMFPFDEQICRLNFTSVAQDRRRLELQWSRDDHEAPSLKHAIFNLLSINTTSTCIGGGISQQSCKSLLVFELGLQRRTFFYLKMYFSPLLMHAIIGVLTFVLPVASGERITYCTTVILGIMFINDNISKKLPDSVGGFPIISQFCYFVLVIATTSLFVNCLTIKLLFHYADRARPSWFVRVFTNGWMACCVGVNAARDQKENNDDDSMKLQAMKPIADDSHHLVRQPLVLRLLKDARALLRKKEGRDNYTLQCVRAAQVWDRVFIVLYLCCLVALCAYIVLTVPNFFTP